MEIRTSGVIEWTRSGSLSAIIILPLISTNCIRVENNTEIRAVRATVFSFSDVRTDSVLDSSRLLFVEVRCLTQLR